MDMHGGKREDRDHIIFVHVNCSTLGKQPKRLANSVNDEKVMSEMYKYVTLVILGENNMWKRGGIGMYMDSLG